MASTHRLDCASRIGMVSFLAGVVLVAVCCGTRSFAASDDSSHADRPPNILMITADNLGYGGLRVAAMARWPGQIAAGTVIANDPSESWSVAASQPEKLDELIEEFAVWQKSFRP